MLLREFQQSFTNILFWFYISNYSIPRLKQDWLNILFHSQDTKRHQWEKCICAINCAHSASSKMLHYALREKKNPVLPDLEKRASFAIFVYTQYYYNNFLFFSLFFFSSLLLVFILHLT